MIWTFAKHSVPLLGALGAAFATSALRAETPSPVVGGTIGFVVTDMHWANFQTADGKAECPDGLNGGPREHYKAFFPDDGTKRKLVDTQLKMEVDQLFPEDWEDPTPFREVKGAVANGLDLDGQVGPEDFTSPDGAKGVDNQLYRVLGCIPSYRGADGTFNFFPNKYVRDYPYNRMLLEIAGVDDLTNDPEVKVTVLRGQQRMRVDATGGKIMPGGSQVVDTQFSERLKVVLRGKIVDGVLVTEPQDATIPWWQHIGGPGEYRMRAMRLHLNLTPTTAEGLIAGYSDIEAWYHSMIRSWHTLIQSYGQFSAPSVYRAMNRLADGYPDPNTGANTAISSAIEAKFTQVFILHPPRPQADGGLRQLAIGNIPATRSE